MQSRGTGAAVGLGPAEAYKAEQRQQWNDEVEARRAWWPAFDRIMTPVTRVMVTEARLRRGAQVLDVASGFGDPALALAGAVGPSGRVLATDLSASMVAAAAARARAAGLANVDVAEMDAEEPVLARGSFDAVTCRLGLMFLPNLDGALARLSELLVPGGRVVAAVWGPPEANRWLAVARQTLGEYLELPRPPRGAPDIFGLAGPGVAAAALARAGLEAVTTRRVTLRCSWPSAAAYTAFHRASPLGGATEGEDHDREMGAWRAVEAAAVRHWGRGRLRLAGEVLVVCGRQRPVLRP